VAAAKVWGHLRSVGGGVSFVPQALGHTCELVMPPFSVNGRCVQVLMPQDLSEAGQVATLIQEPVGERVTQHVRRETDARASRVL